MTRAPHAILFDLDETILTFGRRRDQLVSVAEGFAPREGPLSAETLAAAVEAHLTAFWADEARRKAGRFNLADARRTVVADAFAELADGGARGLTAEAAHRFADAFHALRVAQVRPFPGAIETLDALRAGDVRLALITNGASDVQRAKIERFDLARRFEHVQVEGECGFGKPEPRAYRHALDAIGVEPHQAWIVGDNLEWEVAAPQRLGLYAIWCDAYGQGLPAGGAVTPDRIIRSLTELAPPA